jgi:DnaJ-class molecular chaperone
MNPDDKTAKKKFQEVQAAFDVLSDPQKREMYDRYGSSFETTGGAGRRGAAWGAGPGEGFGGFRFEDIDLGDLFGGRFGEGPGGPGVDLGDLFGQFARGAGRPGKRPAGRRRGSDLESEVEIPFATAINGGEIRLDLDRPGHPRGSVAVKIPAGIEDGKKIRLRGQGSPSPAGGEPGDLLLVVRVAPHPCFQRRGNHLHVKLPVRLSEAVLGAKVDVPTPRGTVALKIPPGTSSGAKLRVKGHGVAPQNGPAGDLFAEVQIVLPPKIDESSREMVRRLDQQYAQDPRANLRW